MKVSIEHKIEVMQSMLNPIMAALAAGCPDHELTGDDIADFFAMGAALVIDNDSHITTPRALRDNAKMIGTRIERHAKELRGMQERAGISLLATIMYEAQIKPGQSIAIN